MSEQIAAFFSPATTEIKSISPPLRRLIEELPRICFSIKGSKAVQAAEFLWQWPGESPAQKERPLIASVKPNGRTALLVSPFVRAAILKELALRFKTLLILSRQQELDAIWNDSLEKLIPRENVWVVKPDAVEDVSTEDSSMQLFELHAKLLLCEYGGRGKTTHTETWLGSANASPRGWGHTKYMNCEAMIRFTPGIRPQQFLEQFAFRNEGSTKDKVLNGWIEQYTRRPVEAESEAEQADRILNEAQEAFAAIAFRALLERTGETITFVLQAVDRSVCQSIFAAHPDISFHVIPLSLANTNESHLADLAILPKSPLRFERLTIGEVGRFLFVQLTHRPSSRKKHFVVRVDVDVKDEFWMERRTAFLKANLSSRDFRLFLRSILFDGAVDLGTFGGGKRNEKEKREPGYRIPSLLDEMTVEDILQACTQDRSRIEEVDRLLKAFDGTDHVDEPFRTFWTNFREAVYAMEATT